MAIVIKDSIYFDVLSRSDKSLMLKALANATINASEKNVHKIALKNEVALELVKSLNTIRTRENGAYGETIGAGAYSGMMSQFNSQYTPGREFGVWTCTKEKFVLSELGKALGNSLVTQEEYMTIIMFNYIQILNNKIISPLEECLKIASLNTNLEITNDSIFTNINLVDSTLLLTMSENEKRKIIESCRLLKNILGETIFFNRTTTNTIRFNGNIKQIKELIKAINNNKILNINDELLSDLSNQQLFSEYITRINDDLKKCFDNYGINISEKLSSLNNQECELNLDNNIINLVEDQEKPQMTVRIPRYTGNSRKTDFVEKNKRQAQIGKAAEKLIYNKEIERIRNINPDLIDKVIWVSVEYGDGLGYDIRSIDIDNTGNIVDKYIEVKATTCSKTTPIDITRNEVECSKYYEDKYQIYRLYKFNSDSNDIKYYKIVGDLSNYILEPSAYKLYI